MVESWRVKDTWSSEFDAPRQEKGASNVDVFVVSNFSLLLSRVLNTLLVIMLAADTGQVKLGLG